MQLSCARKNSNSLAALVGLSVELGIQRVKTPCASDSSVAVLAKVTRHTGCVMLLHPNSFAAVYSGIWANALYIYACLAPRSSAGRNCTFDLDDLQSGPEFLIAFLQDAAG